MFGGAAGTSGELSLERFAPHVGSRFTVTADDGRPVPLTLLEAQPRPAHVADRPGLSGESFSLIFGNGEPKAFDQGTHVLSHADLGSFRLLVVPVGPNVNGQHYQVVVDRRVAPR